MYPYIPVLHAFVMFFFQLNKRVSFVDFLQGSYPSSRAAKLEFLQAMVTVIIRVLSYQRIMKEFMVTVSIGN